MPDIKVVDEYHKIADRRGNGILRREIWADRQGRITRYNLAYINHNLHSGDHGRVIGYDNAHGYHHKHHCGMVEAIHFVSFEDIEARFEQDWIALKARP
ncbi:MAG: transcriptional regulator [Pseudomonadales bacterium]|jgi:hypothetical protein|nr:transcriptional regulator [Pseudomonadales bacterium]